MTPIAMPSTVAEVFDRALAEHPDREALVTSSGRWSYAELDRLSDRAAQALASLGVRMGDRVAGALPNDVDVVVAFHGAMRLGAIWVGVNRQLAAPEKRYLLGDSGTSLLVCDTATAEQLDELAAATGLDADDLFSRLMVAHHAAGAEMAEHAAEHGENETVRSFAAKVAKIQRVEIAELNDRREILGLERVEPESSHG